MVKETEAIVIGLGIEIIFIILGVQIETMPLVAVIIGYVVGALLILYGIVRFVRPKTQIKTDTIQNSEVMFAPLIEGRRPTGELRVSVSAYYKNLARIPLSLLGG